MTVITVLRPDVETPPAQAEVAPRAVRQAALRLTLVENGKPRARELLTLIAAGLEAELEGLAVTVVSKASASWPVDEETARAIADSCDAVITGLGDCGGCSANSLADAVVLEQAGVPATAVITEPFVNLVASYAARLGVPGYPVVVLPHPIASLSDADLEKVAAKAVPLVAERLFAD